MAIYLPNGYVDMRAIRDGGFPFVLLIGGRATGKTYGGLRMCVEDNIKFAYMRRTGTQLDIINKPEFSPMKPICRDTGLQITMRPVAKGLSAFVPYETDDKGKTVISGEPYGFTCALSTIVNLRGFDASDIDIMFYDEFIPEKNERSISHEAEALFNAYETFNRNREIEGRKPLQLICMANANDQTAPVLEYLGLINRIERMRKNGTEIYTDNKRGLLLVLLRDSPISAQKRDTALYQLTEGSDFAEMSLDNEFSYEDRGDIRTRPLREYKPIVTVGGITIYKHKSKKLFYVSTHKQGSPYSFGTSETELERFARTYSHLWTYHMDGLIEFEDFLSRTLFNKYMA